MSTITERVAAGAAWLDAHYPGWDQCMDLDRLSIGSSCNCVLGQLHGSFAMGLLSLADSAEPWDTDTAFGFMWDTGLPTPEREREIDALTAEWKRVITERRAS